MPDRNLAAARKRRDESLGRLISAQCDFVAAKHRVAEQRVPYLGNTPLSHRDVQAATRTLWHRESEFENAQIALERAMANAE